jgi:hypothetical protein
MHTEPEHEDLTPTDDKTPDGTQIPTDDDLPDEEGDAGVPAPDFADLDEEA